jgi:hypothetical protein
MKHSTSRIDCAYYRKRALERRKKPGQDEANEAAAEAIRQRVAEQLAGMPQIQAMNAAVARGDDRCSQRVNAS